MTRIDFRKDLAHLYRPSAREAALVEVPVMYFLMIDGAGDPNQERSYQEAVEALFSVAYAVKFKVKKTLAIDYGVPPLEGLWWADDMAKFSVADKSGWNWTMMIMQPEFVNSAMVRETIAEVKKKKDLPPSPCCAVHRSTKASAPRSSTSALSPPRDRPWPGCMPSSPRLAASSPASTTRSTSPTSARPIPPSGRPSSANRCAREMEYQLLFLKKCHFSSRESVGFSMIFLHARQKTKGERGCE